MIFFYEKNEPFGSLFSLYMTISFIDNHFQCNKVLSAYGNDQVGIAFAGLNEGLVLKPSPR